MIPLGFKREETDIYNTKKLQKERQNNCKEQLELNCFKKSQAVNLFCCGNEVFRLLSVNIANCCLKYCLLYSLCLFICWHCLLLHIFPYCALPQFSYENFSNWQCFQSICSILFIFLQLIHQFAAYAFLRELYNSNYCFDDSMLAVICSLCSYLSLNIESTCLRLKIAGHS